MDKTKSNLYPSMILDKCEEHISVYLENDLGQVLMQIAFSAYPNASLGIRLKPYSVGTVWMKMVFFEI